LSVTAATGEDWPQFRGSGGEGHGQSADLPSSWSETENVAWKTAVEGTAWSSPVIFGKQIWMTTALVTPATPEETKKKLDSLGMSVPSGEVASKVVLKAVCIDRDSGRLLRTITLYNVDDPPQICSVNSYASPTPVVEEGRLYCDFGIMGTACLDTTDGKILWKRDLPIEHQVGPGSSAILYGDLLVLVRDGCYKQYVIALNKKTGKTVWKTARPPMSATVASIKKAFSVPLVIDAVGGKQMIVPAAQWIVSYNPDDGKELWRVDTGGTYSNTTRPVFGHGMIFVSTAFGGTRMLAIKVDGRGDVTDTHVAWEERKGAPRMPSPLLLDDELYAISDKGVATCMDAKSGDIHWTQRVLGKCSASPITVGGRIYFFSEEGKAVVVRAGKKFATVAENELKGKIMASPAVVDNALFVRTATHLYRIQKK
jgi:outer membrane protein assembly factor BamB